MGTPALPYCGLVLTTKTPKRFYPDEIRTIGDHIRARRLDEHLTQLQLAQLLHVTESSVNNWEKGRNVPDVQAFSRILSWLGYNPEPEGTTLRERVARRRRELGLTQEGLAARLGIDEASVQGWEAEETKPIERNRQRLEAFCRGKEAM